MIIDDIKDYKLILASGSPRRQQLMQDAGLAFEIRIKDTAETYPADLDIMKVPEYLSKLKAAPFQDELLKNELLVTADTVVCLHAEILGKPANREHALEILQKLSGNKHTVVTGVCLTTTQKQYCFSAFTDVYFRSLSEDELVYYVDTFKPFDKAGAYGIQEWMGYVGIERIDGSFYNVMGLPIQQLYNVLKNWKKITGDGQCPTELSE